MFENFFLNSKPQLSTVFSSDIHFSSFSNFKSINEQNFGEGIKLLVKTNPEEMHGISLLTKDIKFLSSTFKKIEKSEFDVNSFNIEKDKYTLVGEFILKGINKLGYREQLNYIIQLSFDDKNSNQINGLKIFQNNSISKSTSPLFYRNSDFKAPVHQRLEAIRRGGYALAIADYDNDGHQDILVGSYGPMTFFRGNGKGDFVEDKSTGIPPLDLVKSAVWADFDNDSLTDLMIVRFTEYSDNELSKFYKNVDKVSEEHDLSEHRIMHPAVSFYKNTGNGKFTLISKIDDNEIVEKAMPAVVADFNNDGFLDVYIGYPGVKDFTTFSNDVQKKMGKKIQGLFLNNGKIVFSEKGMSKSSGWLYEYFSPKNILYPHSALATDLNNSGSMDIIVVDDRGNLSPIYRNNGKGEFKESSQKLGIRNYGIGMGVASADINNDGLLDLALSNIAFNVDKRFDTCMKTKTPQVGLRLFVANKVNSENKDLNFSEISPNGINNPGQGLGGIEFIDYDSDGLMDLYVTNGLWSGTDKSFDLTGVVKRAMEDKFGGVLLEGATHTKSYVMDVLANYKNEKNQVASMGGFQSNRLYKNLGKNNFIDVAYVEGVDSIYDGYVMAKADFNNDGVADIILRNADPGTLNVINPPIEIFMSSKNSKNNLTLKLTFKSGNREAIGTRVNVFAADMGIQTQVLVANNGSAQSEKSLLFSLGQNQVANTVEIIWPNGKIEKFKNLKMGQHKITEGDSTALMTQN